VSAGGLQSCGVTPSGTAWCWGSNWGGELGTGSADSLPHPAPEAVAGGLVFRGVSVGFNRSCGVTADGAAYCWGSNSYALLGIGVTDTVRHPAPIQVAGGHHFAAVSLGDMHTCGVLSDGTAVCWGLNQAGGLGDGTDPDVPSAVPTPGPVLGGHSFAGISAGSNTSCAATPSGAAWCWGYGGNGELGNDSLNNGPAPVAVSGGLTFASVSTGAYHSCGVTTEHVAYCWGSQSLLGRSDSQPMCYMSPVGPIHCSVVPVPVEGGLAFTSVSTGDIHTCGVTDGGSVYCWGDNRNGQLGDGTTTRRLTPVRVAGT